MGFSADQSMTLISKAQMDSLEGRRADINLEKMALMREQESLALEYNDAMSNTCFVSKNEDTGEYEAIAPQVTSSGKINGFANSNGALDGYTAKTSLDSQSVKDLAKNKGTLKFAQAVKNGQIDLYNPKGKQVDIAGVAGVSETYYTADDAAAQAEYDAAMAKIRTKETKLDMDLEQVETQYQAIKTQYESARQLVNQRAQSDFKFFQG